MSKSTGDQLDDCRDSFKEEHLQDYLKRVVNNLKISRPKYRIKSASKVGDNYVGIVYRVFIEGEKDGVPVKIQTIFKVAPKGEFIREACHVAFFFPREHFFYTEIVPIYKKFLKEKNKSLENVAECYFSSIDDHKEAICLEDLRPKGFVMRDRIKQMDLAHVSLAFRALGRFHALSFALRDQRPEIFKSKIATLTEPLFRPNLIVSPEFIARRDMLGKLVKTALADEDPRYTERVSEFLKHNISRTAWSCDGSNAEPYAVLNHGDYSLLNMLFTYEGVSQIVANNPEYTKAESYLNYVTKNSTEPEDIYLLDFQMSRYASPAIDISYMLFCNCGQVLRENYFHEIVKTYHESLSTYLLELGSDPTKLFPYEALLAQLDQFSVYGAGLAMLVLPLFLSKGNDIQDVASGLFDPIGLERRIRRDDLFRNTLRDTYKDLIDRNYI